MSSKLQSVKPVSFDVDNIEHRSSYINFLNTGKWPMAFDLEWPFTSIPAMVMFKLAIKACEAEGQVNEEELLAKAFVIGPKAVAKTVHGARLGLVA